MKKDTVWIRGEFEKIILHYLKDEDPMLKIEVLNKVSDLFNQLDEPEVLSLDWIDDNKKDSGVHSIGYYVPIGRLRDLLVPKQEEVEEGRVRLIVGFDGGTESYYATDIGDALDFLTDYDARFTVSKEPVIPKFVADEFETMDASGLMSEFESVDHILTATFSSTEPKEKNKALQWVRDNPEEYVMAAKFGYKVEEEQKYYVLIKGKSSYLGHTGCFLFKEDNDLTIYTGDNLSAFDKNNERYQFTEQEVKDYDERYWAFAEPVEELEE